MGLLDDAKKASTDYKVTDLDQRQDSWLDVFVDPIAFHVASANRRLFVRQEALPSSSSKGDPPG